MSLELKDQLSQILGLAPSLHFLLACISAQFPTDSHLSSENVYFL